jgi:uncharacterized protein
MKSWIPIACAVLLSCAPCYGRGVAGANRLIHSDDPYLLMHGHDPVDWYPWGAEALSRAKRENKPIFVSIGYSSCYWCHVAERELYSNPAIAGLMNKWFINIKIDREERPDLDSIYMEARQLLTGGGGWPNNLFLTPDLKPFFAGSYFPPRDHADGARSFPSVLQSLHAAWLDRHQDLVRQGDEVLEAMRDRREDGRGTTLPDYHAAVKEGVDHLLSDTDWDNGGIAGGNKFPRTPSIELLLTDYEVTHSSQSLAAATRWLDGMALGGIRDQLDGGFHRYSVDPIWSVPHFEKMLYDNAQLLHAYTRAFRLTGSQLYREVAVGLADYLGEQLTAPGGGFYSSQDAETGGQEGAVYLWTRGEIDQLIGVDKADEFLSIYSLTPVLAEDAVPDAHAAGVLRVGLHGSSDLVSALQGQAATRKLLLVARKRRGAAPRDEQIIVAWNGLAILALAEASEGLQRPDYLGLAIKAADRIWTAAYEPRLKLLQHEIYDGRAKGVGFLQDYAMLGLGYRALAQATHDGRWQSRADLLTALMVTRFQKSGGLATASPTSNTFVAAADVGDDAAPSGTSAAIALLRSHGGGKRATDEEILIPQIVSSLGKRFSRHPERWPSLLATLAWQADPVSPLNSAGHMRITGTLEAGPTEDEFIVAIDIDPGYHVNANPASYEYLIATQLSIDGHPELSATYPAPVQIKPTFAPAGLNVYEGKVVLKVPLPKHSITASSAVSAQLTVQACSSDACLQPDTIPIPMGEAQRTAYPRP